MSISPIITQSYDTISSIAFQANFVTKKESRDIEGLLGYIPREGFLGSIRDLVHRIWNAIKAIFWQSDWELAVSSLASVQAKLKDRLLLPVSTRELPSEELAMNILENLTSLNRAIKQHDTILLGIFKACIQCVNKERIGADLASGSGIFDQGGWIAWQETHPGDEELSHRIFTLLAEREYITSEGVEMIRWASRLAQ
ncbi:hypothetical protein [Estrella lausannensis]|uniref:Uncharacterized protein n=1 Tax=Estrella lausannensis TaxID=483423 RepID=A0A0H5E728_9BACT|nr:hypothetical protein [Estrella lausannensis]CRX39110.1 hypothetical protein ELAC_1784 [Estrella lausannensis]